jgi:hypothetical protein
MSIIRFGDDSDVYLIATFMGGARVVACMGCKLGPGRSSPSFSLALAACSHLDDHRSRGHRVPERAYDRTLERDDWLNGGNDDRLDDVSPGESSGFLREQDGPAEEGENPPLGGTGA